MKTEKKKGTNSSGQKKRRCEGVVGPGKESLKLYKKIASQKKKKSGSRIPRSFNVQQKTRTGHAKVFRKSRGTEQEFAKKRKTP